MQVSVFITPLRLLRCGLDGKALSIHFTRCRVTFAEHRIIPEDSSIMATKAIWVMLKAKPGKEAEVEAFLKQGAAMSNDEPQTVTWYGVKMAPGMYGVFDTFNDEAGRDAHLTGEIAKALMANAPDLFSNEIHIEKMDILADK
jgi:quinol monooxygenase YgiN